jgi:DNA polymerase-1
MLSNAKLIFAGDGETLRRGIDEIRELPVLAVDTETTGLDPFEHKILLFQAGTDRVQLVVDCRRVDAAPLSEILAGPQVKVFHNAKFDIKFLEHGFSMRVHNVADAMLIEEILENSFSRNAMHPSLFNLALKYLAVELDKEMQKSFLETDGGFSERQIEYARMDVAATYRVFLRQMERLKKEALFDTARLESRAVRAYARMELLGVPVDATRWKEAAAETEKEYTAARAALNAYFKDNAPRDLFGDIDADHDGDEKLKAMLKKTGYHERDFKRETMAASDHEGAHLLLAYREARSAFSTHNADFLRFIHRRDGRLHADFRQIAAPSGRSSCADPNLQAIPKTERYRGSIRAPEGRKIITADYAGCELRIIAEASGDPIFIKTFLSGGDLHSMVAQSVFGVKVSRTENPGLRAKAKVINFGLAYGMGPGALAAQMKADMADEDRARMNVREAEKLLAKYFKTFPTIYSYLETSAADAVKRGFCMTLGGRKCRLPDPKGMTEADRQAVLRFAKNMPIQGTNADIAKLAMTRIDEEFEKAGLSGGIINMVHDELVAEVPADRAREAAGIVKDQMMKAGARFVRHVPMEVECHIGDYWGHKGEAM